MPRSRLAVCLTLFATLALLGGCDRDPAPGNGDAGKATSGAAAPKADPNTSGAGQLVIYCGRSKSLVEPLIEQFRKDTGIDAQVRYGSTAELAATIMEEGARSPADVYWAQDAASLAQLSQRGVFATLPESTLSKVAPKFRSDEGFWVGTSGRARVLAYAPSRITPEQLPKSVFDLTDAKWKGRVGWAPSNASFKAFVTAMRHAAGDEKTMQWLTGMKANEAKAYAKNTPIIEALAAGEIDLGLPNHYYLLRFKQKDANYPVEQTFFAPGDIGNLLLVSGVGVLKTAKNQDAAQRFVDYLLSANSAQRFFAGDDFEYPVVSGVKIDPRLPGHDKLEQVAPHVDLDTLDDLQRTEELLRQAGVL